MDALGLSSSKPSFVKAALYHYHLGNVVRNERVRRPYHVDAIYTYGT